MFLDRGDFVDWEKDKEECIFNSGWFYLDKLRLFWLMVFLFDKQNVQIQKSMLMALSIEPVLAIG